MNANILNDSEIVAAFLRVKAVIGQARSGITGRASFGAVEPMADGAIDVTDQTIADRDVADRAREFIRNRDRNAPARRNPADGIDQAVPGSDDLEDLA